MAEMGDIVRACQARMMAKELPAYVAQAMCEEVVSDEEPTARARPTVTTPSSSGTRGGGAAKKGRGRGRGRAQPQQPAPTPTPAPAAGADAPPAADIVVFLAPEDSEESGNVLLEGKPEQDKGWED